jgi:cobalt-zinc-cadmium efflux system membrane fusion protein
LLAVKNGLEEKLRLININPSSLSVGNIQRSINIVAPFNGMVSKVMVNKGKYVAASDELVELINPEGLLLALKVFEKDLEKIKIGQHVKVYKNADPDKKINGKILTKGSSIEEDGSAEIIAKLTDANSIELINGLYINALIDVGNMDAYTLPSDAIVSFTGKNFIFEQLDKNTFRLNEVEIGNAVEGNTAILNPDNFIDKKIVNKGAYALLMALKNKVEE